MQPIYRYILHRWPFIGGLPASIHTLHDFYAYLRGLSDSKKKVLWGIYWAGVQAGQIEDHHAARYALYGSTTKELQKTRDRGRNRRVFQRRRMVARGDGTQIHHLDGNALNNHPSNLIVLTHCQHQKMHGRSCARRR
jgi:hypothetical protein